MDNELTAKRHRGNPTYFQECLFEFFEKTDLSEYDMNVSFTESEFKKIEEIKKRRVENA
jgi:hypothetical protein